MPLPWCVLLLLLPMAQPLDSPFLRLGQPSRAPLGVNLRVIVIIASMLDLSIQRFFIKNMIVGFIFQLILGFNPAPQLIMHGDTSFSVFTSADWPTASVIITLSLENMVVLTRAVAFRAVVSRREP
jgi:hypothetical protein